jgi:membrane protein implicated in regulation of membrane protease activity
VRPRDDGPGALAWLIAFVSLVLPWAGLALGIFGILELSRGDRAGWWWLAGGLGLIVADALIDLVWAHPTVMKTDQPDLNRRGGQLVGRILVVEEAIEAGRGKVRVGDTLWPAEGPDLPAGTEVRVTAAKATLLVVERT